MLDAYSQSLFRRPIMDRPRRESRHTTESRFATCLNRLLQQNRHEADIAQIGVPKADIDRVIAQVIRMELLKLLYLRNALDR